MRLIAIACVSIDQFEVTLHLTAAPESVRACRIPEGYVTSHATIFVDWSLIHLASKTVNKINFTPACHNGVPQALHGTPFCRILRLRI